MLLILFCLHCILPVRLCWAVLLSLITAAAHLTTSLLSRATPPAPPLATAATAILYLVMHVSKHLASTQATIIIERDELVHISLFASVETDVVGQAVSWAGGYTKYLTEQAQRKAFLETRRSLENRYRTQQENERQGNTNLGDNQIAVQRTFTLSLSLFRKRKYYCIQ